MTRLRGSAKTLPRPEGVHPNAVASVFRVPPDVAGQRLDLFIQAQLKRTSRTRTQEIIRKSAYDAAGRRLRASDRVYAEQRVCLWRAPWDEAAVPTELPIVYEDEHLLAVNKPAHLPVHPTARFYHNTLIKLLQASRPGEFLSLAHRLDRETSGALLVAKSVPCDRALKRQLEYRDELDKRYLALTWGVPGGAEIGERFRFEQAVELDPISPYRVKMRSSEAASALYAVTWFEVLAVITAGGRTYAKVRCDLETGRQHQIRVHLATLGSPIVGDKLYGPDETCFARGVDGELTLEDDARLELPRHALHAWQLALRHPMTGAPLFIEAPPPDDLVSFWSGLGGR